MVDKNLFLYDLAIVSIMKNNSLYIKEWLDYHLLAGVDHFYIYDNGSTDNFSEVIKPYVDKGIVTKLKVDTWNMGIPAYNEAANKFRFQSRYIAFIDSDEFIFPKSKSTIAEIIDEVFGNNTNASGLGVNWRMFGSNGLEKADFTRGVIDRFTKRAKNVDHHIKTIANPRKIDFFLNPHYAIYFIGAYSVNENGNIFAGPFNEDKTSDKICINHYYTKSVEEFQEKINLAAQVNYKRDMNYFNIRNKEDNEVFDDGIIKYRDARRDALLGKGGGIETLFARKQINPARLFNALAQNLITTTVGSTPRNFYAGKIDNFLTCLYLSGYLRGKLFDDDGAKIFEELSLNALYKSLSAGCSIADILLLIDELPIIFEMNYSAVKKIRDACINIIPQIMTHCRMYNQWQKFTELAYTLKLLKKIK